MSRPQASIAALLLLGLMALPFLGGDPAPEAPLRPPPHYRPPPLGSAERPLDPVGPNSPLEDQLDPSVAPFDETHPLRILDEAALQAHPAFTARCALAHTLDGEEAVLRLGADLSAPAEALRISPLRGGVVYLLGLPAAGEGWLRVEGFGPLLLRWADGACLGGPLTLPVEPEAVEGLVVDPAGAPAGTAHVEGCGDQAWSSEDGAFRLRPAPGPCALRASRREGAWRRESTPTPIQAEPLRLTLALVPRASLGLSLRDGDGRLSVDAVLPEGGAAEAGLRPGDILLRLDDHPLEGLTLVDLAPLAQGPVGSVVSLEVEREGRRFTVPITRRSLSLERR